MSVCQLLSNAPKARAGTIRFRRLPQEENIMRKLLLLSAAVTLSGCSLFGVNADYVGCDTHTLQWTFGPSENQPFIDACYAQLDISELQKYYQFVPIEGSNPDTGQVIDANRDGIGDGIRRNARVYNQRIFWGDRCALSALRIQQKGCLSLGNSDRTGGCDWMSIQIRAKPGVKYRKVELTPIWRVRLPDGSERDLPAKTLSTGVKTCS
jgi:hypothetical protein